jgi:hypothetical protein
MIEKGYTRKEAMRPLLETLLASTGFLNGLILQPHYDPEVDSASNSNLPEGKEQSAPEADYFTTICEPTVWTM